MVAILIGLKADLKCNIVLSFINNLHTNLAH